MKLKQSIIRFFFAFACLLYNSMPAVGSGDTYSMDKYTKYPPFISRFVKPNVIVALDISGSMKEPAYQKIVDGLKWKQVLHDDFDKDETYFGYFDSGKRYTYNRANEFFVVDDADGEWSGNFLNWLSMRRIDVSRKVLAGGKVSVKLAPEPFTDLNGNKVWDEGEGYTDENGNGAWDDGVYNRNRTPHAKEDWGANGWDDYYILEGQREPEDYEPKKKYASNNTEQQCTVFADGQEFRISDGSIIEHKQLNQVSTTKINGDIEVGNVTMRWDWNPEWVWVAFENTYTQPRVVVKSLTHRQMKWYEMSNREYSDPRIKWKAGQEWPHTGAEGFYVRLQPWDYYTGFAMVYDGATDDLYTETFTYMVVESANGWIDVTMDDGSVWKFYGENSQQEMESANCGTSAATAKTVTFSPAAANTPIVFTGISSYNDTSSMVTRNAEVSTASVDVILQKQVKNISIGSCTLSSNENIHVIAVVPPGGADTSIAKGEVTFAGKTTTIQAGIQSGVNHEWKTIKYNTDLPFDHAPYFIADMQTMADSDPSNLRVAHYRSIESPSGYYRNNNSNAIEIKVAEESSKYNGVEHTSSENVGWIAFDGGVKRYKIRVGVSTEPQGIVHSVQDTTRLGLAVYNYNHERTGESLYTGNNMKDANTQKGAHGGTLNPCFTDEALPPDQRSNYDICLPTGVHDPVENILTTIELHPIIWGATPIAETLYEIYNYFDQQDGAYSSNGLGYYDDKSTADTYPTGEANDPFFYADRGQKMGCATAFVLSFSDGQPAQDWDNKGWTASPTSHPVIGDDDGDGNSGPGQQLDDLAHWLRKNDLRGDLDGHQEIVSYYVYAALGQAETFNSESAILREAAVNGGFLDLDEDREPDPAHGDINTYITSRETDPGVYDCSDQKNEWDRDGDCNPDGFFFANDGYELVEKLQTAFQSILARVSSGTAVSVVSHSRSGEGAVYQSVFYPDYTDPKGNWVRWAGKVHSLLVDAYGNTREDTNKNKKLDLSSDKFLLFDDNAVFKYTDTNANGILDASEHVEANREAVSREAINYLWSTNDWLNHIPDTAITAQRTYSSAEEKRYIFTFADANQNMVADANEQVDFTCTTTPTNAQLTDPAKFYSYMNLYPPISGNITAAPSYIEGIRANYASNPGPFFDYLRNQTKRLVDYIRGRDQSAYRSSTSPAYTIPAFRPRQIDRDDDDTNETWRLGDIVSSTPTIVGRPSERYDLIYKDATYTAFYSKYRNRRNVLYAGANDGMFHAFNAGFYNRDDLEYETQPDGDYTYAAHELGAELWAYVPYNLLPHLHWLADIDYSHIYYSDLKPKIFDAKIFPDSDKHPHGWGTLLVAGMRFGGGKIAADVDKTDGAIDLNGEDREMNSAYFVLDITDPESPPTLLAEIALPGQGFTTGYPAVVPMRDLDNIDPNKWYLVFGSGPIGDDVKTVLAEASSDQKAKLFVVDLVELASNGELVTWTTGGAKVYGAGAPYYLAELDNKGFISDPISVDYDMDFETDVMYFGTVAVNQANWRGKLRRILTNGSPSPASWTTDNTLIDVGQPIVAAPSVGVDSDYNRWIFFGTGRYFTADDAEDDSQQSYYGVKETYTDLRNDHSDNDGDSLIDEIDEVEWTWTTVNKAHLEDVSDVVVFEGGNPVQGVTDKDGDGDKDYDDLISTIRNKDGWVMDFDTGNERNLGQATLFGEILTFTTFMPDIDPCAYEGESNLYAVDFLTGTAYAESVIGTDANSTVEDPDNPGEQIEEVKKMITIGAGLITTPAIHTGRERGSKVFIQSSTGVIKTFEEENPGITQSRQISWQTEE